MADSTQPIIIKKVKKAAHAHHGGAWKIAYADFVTAMMAFFMVMWLVVVFLGPLVGAGARVAFAPLTDRWGGAKSRGLGWGTIEATLMLGKKQLADAELVDALRSALTQGGSQ